MAMEDLLDPEDVIRLDKTPFEWLLEVDDNSFKSMGKENALGIIVFGLYFYIVYQLMTIGMVDPNAMWPWFWRFMAQVILVFFGSWMGVIRWKGNSLVLEADFYKPDGTRATGNVMLSDQPLTISKDYLVESIEKMRGSYDRIRDQRIKKLQKG